MPRIARMHAHMLSKPEPCITPQENGATMSTADQGEALQTRPSQGRANPPSIHAEVQKKKQELQAWDADQVGQGEERG